MSSQEERQEAWHRGPQQGAIAAIDFSTSSAEVSLTTELGENPAGKLLTMVSDVAVFYAFSDGSATAIDETNVTPGNAARAALLPANVPMRVTPTGTHITTKAAGAGILRMWVSSD